jgi:uncharacterized OsmC-like protein
LIFMPNIFNNVDLDKIAKTVDAGKKDRPTLRKPVRLHGEWLLDSAEGYQFRTEMSYEKGKQMIEIDSPSFMGGSGNRLGPMAYCVTGIASCFVSTFASIAAMMNVKLTKLTVDTECMVNFAKTFDVADEPIMEGLKLQVDAQSENTDRSKLEKILEMAQERCPAIYSMTHVIKVQAELK